MTLAAQKSDLEEMKRLWLTGASDALVGNVWGNPHPFRIAPAPPPFRAEINSLSPQVGQTVSTTNQRSLVSGGTFSAIPARPITPHFEFLKEKLDVSQYGCELLGEAKILSSGSGRSLAFLKLLMDEPIAELEQTPFSTGGIGRTTTETITPDAEEYACSTGIFGSLVVAKAIVKEIMGTLLSAIHIDRMEDPEDLGHVSFCLQLSVSGSVDEIYELDKTLQRTLIEKIPNEDFPFIGVLYQFE